MEYRTITYKQIRENPEVNAPLEAGKDVVGGTG